MNKNVAFMIMACLVLSGMMTSIYLPVNPSEQQQQLIRVMSYNLHQYYVADDVMPFQKSGNYIFEDLLKVIQRESPKIIGFQEAEGGRLSSGNVQGVAWLAEQLDMYYYFGAPTSDQTYGNAILSEWPISTSEYKIYPRPEGIERTVTRVTINSPSGQLNVFNTHFEISRFQQAQNAQANYLINYVGSTPAIITGDFNTKFGDPTYNILNQSFTYGMIESGLAANASQGYTSPADNPRVKIDYIWLTRGDFNVVFNSYRTIGSGLTSDHLGILVDISLR